MIGASRGRARIGVLVPFTNTNLEADLALMRPEGVSFHYARLGGYEADEIPDADQMAALGASDIDEPLRLLAGARPDVILYGCTSATLTHGRSFDRALAGRIARTSGAATVTAAGALVAALEALGVKRIGFASPYVPQINDQAIAFLRDCFIETVSRAGVENPLGNYGQGELSPQDVFGLGLRCDSPEAEAIVLSCTDMRGVEVIGRLEQALGKPVVTSNQAMLFEALRGLGVAYGGAGFGMLFDKLTAGTALL